MPRARYRLESVPQISLNATPLMRAARALEAELTGKQIASARRKGTKLAAQRFVKWFIRRLQVYFKTPQKHLKHRVVPKFKFLGNYGAVVEIKARRLGLRAFRVSEIWRPGIKVKFRSGKWIKFPGAWIAENPEIFARHVWIRKPGARRFPVKALPGPSVAAFYWKRREQNTEKAGEIYWEAYYEGFKRVYNRAIARARQEKARRRLYNGMDPSRPPARL